MVNFKSVVKKLQKHYPDASEVAVLSSNGKLLFSTPKWNIKSDIKPFLKDWASGSAQFVELDGIRYSILQMEPERFIGTNRHKKGHLVGATTPNKDKLMIAHIKSKSKGWFHMAYPAIARAAAMMEKGSNSEFIGTKVDLNNVSDGETPQLSTPISKITNPPVDPFLKAEIEGLLEWFKTTQGLYSYVSYALQNNDLNKICELARIYNELYHLFYG
ncbi:MAG: hypothetical protein EU532_13315 [Promethearchaeota archaeon]|nr:MAG: hypothetical protein EU532_13315 [Candidatus Lokiarchaeota archaeon]